MVDMDLHELLLGQRIGIDALEATDVPGSFHEVAQALVDARMLAGDRALELAEALVLREHQGTTAFGFGLAIPHAFHDALDRVHVVVARHAQGLDMGAVDGEPTRVLICIVGPEEERGTYLALLRSIAGIVRDRQWRSFIHQAGSSDVIFETLVEAATT